MATNRSHITARGNLTRPTDPPDFGYIKVGLTDANVEECIEVDITRPADKKRVHLILHTTEAIDLHRKLGNALTDWVAEAAVAFMQKQGRP